MNGPPWNLSPASRRALSGVHPDLVRVVERAAEISPLDFRVSEGRRTILRQRQLLAAGATRTLNSRHLNGHAVDLAALVGGRVRWDWPLYARLAEFMRQAAEELGIPIIWGGSWKSFRDGPHFELDRRRYP